MSDYVTSGYPVGVGYDSKGNAKAFVELSSIEVTQVSATTYLNLPESATSLSALTDTCVDESGPNYPLTSEVLTWNGTCWVPSAIPAGGGGITDPGGKSPGDLLVYTGSWEPYTQSEVGIASVSDPNVFQAAQTFQAAGYASGPFTIGGEDPTTAFEVGTNGSVTIKSLNANSFVYINGSRGLTDLGTATAGDIPYYAGAGTFNSITTTAGSRNILSNDGKLGWISDVDTAATGLGLSEDGYVLSWNNSNGQWEATAPAGASLPTGSNGKILAHNGASWIAADPTGTPVNLAAKDETNTFTQAQIFGGTTPTTIGSNGSITFGNSIGSNSFIVAESSTEGSGLSGVYKDIPYFDSANQPTTETIENILSNANYTIDPDTNYLEGLTSEFLTWSAGVELSAIATDTNVLELSGYASGIPIGTSDQILVYTGNRNFNAIDPQSRGIAIASATNTFDAAQTFESDIILNGSDFAANSILILDSSKNVSSVSAEVGASDDSLIAWNSSTNSWIYRPVGQFFGTKNLSSLGQVTYIEPDIGNVFTWNGGSWVASEAPGGGGLGSFALSDATDVDYRGSSPTLLQALLWSSTGNSFVPGSIRVGNIGVATDPGGNNLVIKNAVGFTSGAGSYTGDGDLPQGLIYVSSTNANDASIAESTDFAIDLLRGNPSFSSEDPYALYLSGPSGDKLAAAACGDFKTFLTKNDTQMEFVGPAEVSATTPAAATGKVWLDTTTSAVKVYDGTSWVDNQESLSGLTDTDINDTETIQIGQGIVWDGTNWLNKYPDQNFLRVYNNTGSTLTTGNCVVLSGAHNPNVAYVGLARADSQSTMPAIGMVYADIAPGAEGAVVSYGKVNGVNTSGMTAGQKVYVSPTTAGGITNVRPTNGSHLVQNIGVVMSVHATNGVIKVTGIGRSNDIPNGIVTSSVADVDYLYVDDGNVFKKIPLTNLASGIDLNDLGDVAASPATLDTLYWNGTTWTNTNAMFSHILDSSIHYTQASIDHGIIGGLSDDDHPQYTLADGSRTMSNLTVSGDINLSGDLNVSDRVSFAKALGMPVVLDRGLSSVQISGTSEQAALEYTVPANTMGSNGGVDIIVRGYVRNNSGSNLYLEYKSYWGGTRILYMPGIVRNGKTSPFEIKICIRNLEDTSLQDIYITTLMGDGQQWSGYEGLGNPFQSTSQYSQVHAPNGTGGGGTEPVKQTKDTTSDQTFELAFRWQTSNSLAYIQMTNYEVILYPSI